LIGTNADEHTGRFGIHPNDDHNRTLISNTHPPDWKNPDPAGRYHLVVIGAGTAGLVSAAGAAVLGAKVALVERGLFGGDCLVTGCVPSKSLIRASRVMAELARARALGAPIPSNAPADFATVMERVRRIRANISHHDAVFRFQELGVDVFLGDGRFTGPDRVEVAGKRLRFKKAVIATGARPVVPPIEGLAKSGYVTNETVFNLTERPKRLLVLGGGPIGCELAQAFSRLGSKVTIVEMEPRFLNREDPDAAEILAREFEKDGIDLRLNTGVKRVVMSGNEKQVHLESNGEGFVAVADAILVGVGRAPNVEGLCLAAAGVEHDTKTGVHVNDRLQTSNPRIYAAGDVCLPYQFTHAADATARIAIQNSLFLGRRKWTALTIPWCTYTDPEIAHVGMYEQEARGKGFTVETFQIPMSEVDRAIVDGEENGFVKIHVKKGTDQILGATIVARHAGEMINELTLAIVHRIGLGSLANLIHPYPTQAEAVKMAADRYQQTRLTPFVKAVLSRWLNWSAAVL
jgi:pyruvate/2-oxoglutarate dehydrogenase complex dihydrolipoamide dehydrogenase (E3) component